ncbi:hypothetical protein BDW22DRAFT_1354280 [Trametopsis cervina]|nr:hypothetical protein BDW22DRAFT_1354280 [Trametopsis cervina]
MSLPTDSANKDLNDSRVEALSAILQSLSPGTAEPPGRDGANVAPDHIRKLSDKLGEILGDQVESGGGVKRNEKGELLNEEGLPIVDINEPVTAADFAFRPDPGSSFDDPDLLPLWTLSATEKARRKAERDRILDLLEAEEKVQERRDAEAAREHYLQEMENRKQAAKTEMENLKKARELQKKMGRALIRSVVENRDQEEKERVQQAEHDRLVAETKVPKAKKSVSFADDIDDNGRIKSADKGKDTDWGDVAPGTLRPNGQVSSDRQPMKLHVVERHPRGLDQSTLSHQPDSDDESDSDVVEDTEDGDTEDDAFGSHNLEPVDSDEDLPGDEEISEWNDEDLNLASLQREAALAYYAKRQTIGAEAASAMRAHSHEEDEWDQPEVPLEATLASAPPKPATSRFKMERTARADPGHTLASHSLATSVLPSSSSGSIKRAVRMGALKNGQLAGGEEGDSEDETIAHDENARAMLDLLRKGEVTNIGPSSSAASAIPPSASASAAAPPPETPRNEPADSISQPKPSKVSKFKLSLAQVEMPVPGTSSSTSSTPSNNAERSSPKILSTNRNSPDTPSAGSPSSQQPQQPRFTLPPEIQAAFQSGELQAQMPGMVVESPSFMPLRGSRGAPSSAAGNTSLPVPSGSTEPAALANSTSAAPPSSPENAKGRTPAPTPMRQAVVERRPPTIDVSPQGQSVNGATKARVSRFKAQRS